MKRIDRIKAMMFGGLLTSAVLTLSILIVYFNLTPSFVVAPIDFYVVAIGNFASHDVAETNSQVLSTRSCSQKIVKKADKYTCVAAVYLDNSAATAVVKRLSDIGFEADLWRLSARRLVVSSDNLQELNAYIEAAKYVGKAVATLIEASNNFDLQRESYEQTIEIINKQASLVNKMQSALLKLDKSNCQGVMLTLLDSIKVQYAQIIKSDKLLFSSAIKTACYQIIERYNDCVNSEGEKLR